MDFNQKVEEIIKIDIRYKPDAYEFVMQALWFAQKKLKKEGHINGRELLEGIREFGLEQYGPMTRAVFEHWGIKATADFGDIVFNMVRNGIMSKTDKDSPEEFKDVYEFKEAFDIFRIRK